MNKVLKYFIITIFSCLSCQWANSQISVINIVPNTRSFDSLHDSEPNLAVNPACPRKIVASAFTSMDINDRLAPVYVTLDGGNEWFLKRTIPDNYWPKGSSDITLRFNGPGDTLYLALLTGISAYLDFQLLKIPMQELENDADHLADMLSRRPYVDQPYIQAATILGGDGRNSDKVYVGNNNNFLNPSPSSSTNISTIDFLPQSLRCPPSTDNFEIIDEHPISDNSRADESAVRTAVHPSGVVYAVFYRIRQRNFVPNVADRADVVIVRDDHWAGSCPRFADLTEGPSVGPPMTGKRIVQDSIVPYNSSLGANRLVGSNLSIAVDPRNSAILYVAWADSCSTDRKYTLHVRRSSSSGQSWPDTDLITVKSAINPALAVNTNGKVAFLYQQMIPMEDNDCRWDTHLARSSDSGATWTDDTLSRFLQSTTPFDQLHREQVYLGDYLHLMAAGKDFYGIFSASNYPDSANFPRRICYQRNANFQTHQILSNDNSTVVRSSIDPFFLHVTELDSTDDFYVRDFTNSTSDFDEGVEPSIDPHFCRSSDVWNMRSDGDPGLNGNDPPPTGEDPQQGTNLDNFGFVRVYRKKPGPPLDVNLHFLFSEFGLGNNFSVAGPDASVHFNERDEFQTLRQGHKWHLPPHNSNHNCLAIEISTQRDPIISPSLAGRVPGWDNGTDLMVFNDNNKAQRNMGLFTTTGTGPASPMPGTGASGTSTMSMTTAVMYAVIHNPNLEISDIQIRPVINPIAKTKPRASVIRGEEASTIKSKGDIIIKGMRPGESRILKISYPVPAGRPGKNFSLTYNQVKNDVVVNAFTILNQYASIDEVIVENLRYEGAILARINTLYGEIDSASLLMNANRTIVSKKPSPKDYLDYLKKNTSLTRSIAGQLIFGRHTDPFGLFEAVKTLQRQINRSDVARAADAHLSLLNTIDAYLTSLQLQKGNVADIYQTIRLQSAILRKTGLQDRDKAVGSLLELSDAFVSAFEKRNLTIADYRNELKNMLNDLKGVAISLGKTDDRLMSLLKTMGEKTDPAELQGQHIKFLLLLKEILNQK